MKFYYYLTLIMLYNIQYPLYLYDIIIFIYFMQPTHSIKSLICALKKLIIKLIIYI